MLTLLEKLLYLSELQPRLTGISSSMYMTELIIRIHSFSKTLLFNKVINIFHVAVRLFSNRSQRTSKCDKNISDCASCATFLFLPHFDVICDLLLNRRTTTWNLFALYNKELNYTWKQPFYFKFCHFARQENSTLTQSIVHTKWSEPIGCYA